MGVDQVSEKIFEELFDLFCELQENMVEVSQHQKALVDLQKRQKEISDRMNAIKEEGKKYKKERDRCEKKSEDPFQLKEGSIQQGTYTRALHLSRTGQFFDACDIWLDSSYDLPQVSKSLQGLRRKGLVRFISGKGWEVVK